MVGIGSIKFKMWDETIKILAEVRHILDLKRNLVSLGMLDKKRLQLQVKGWSIESDKGFFSGDERPFTK